MAAILFNGLKPCEPVVNTSSTESFIWNVVKNGQAVSKTEDV